MIRALIIDDELHAREEMEALLQESGAFSMVGSCSNALEALSTINKERPDVVFLDIQMPMISGFELLNMVPQEIMPHVVFVTAFEEYSLKAFEEKTLDYLLKPVSPQRLQKTIAKLKDMLEAKAPTAFAADTITRIPCSIGKRIRLVALNEVHFVSATPRGNFIVTAEDEFFTDIALKVLEERTNLVRCHKQYLVNMDLVQEITLQDNGTGMLTTSADAPIPVSRRYLKVIKKMLLI